MVRSMIRIVAIIFNCGIIFFILGLALHESMEFDNVNFYLFIGLAVVAPLVNIFGLFERPKVITPLIALAVNTLVLAAFSFIILLVMIWPMGSKPRGVEMVYIFSLYSALLITETAHVLRLKKKQRDQGP